MRDLRRKPFKKWAKKILSLSLVAAMVLTSIPQTAYAEGKKKTKVSTEAENEISENIKEIENETIEENVLEQYGLIGLDKGVRISCSEAEFNANLYSGQDFTCAANKTEVKGTIEAAGHIVKQCTDFKAEGEEENCEKMTLPDIRTGIESKSEEWEEESNYVTVVNEEICDGFKKSSGGIQISGSHFSGNCYMIAEESIQYSVDGLGDDEGRLLLYSENGDIIISGNNIVINGIFAAPNGTVRISGNNVTVNGRIYADGVEISCLNLALNASEEDMDMIEEGADVIKLYDTDTEFEEGKTDGTVIGQDSVKLKKTGSSLETVKKEYNSETESGIAATVTLEDKGADMLHYNIVLNGKVKQTFPDLEKNAYFQEYNGHLYAFVKKSVYWNDAKKLCEEWGGHLATVSSPEENDMLKKLANQNGGGYTALGFSDAEKEGQWKWITGEENIYTNWNPGEPNDAYGSGQDHAYMYSYGTWDDAYDGISNYFFCEWEDEEAGIVPAGRNIQVVVEVNGKAKASDQWESIENEDGTTTMVYFSDKLMSAEAVSLDMDIQTLTEDGYRQVIKDSYYVYYDAEGKGHRIEMGNIWQPVKQYTESGTWKTTYDSGKNGTKWKKLWWEADQAGDSSVEVYAAAYDNKEKKPEAVLVQNKEELEGLKGRYIDIRAVLTEGQDYRTPVLDKVYLAGGKAEDDYYPEDSVPTGELYCSTDITAGSEMNGYFKISGGMEKLTGETKWSLTSAKGEPEESEYKLEQITPYFVKFSVSKKGSYYLKAETKYGEEIITAEKQIFVKPTSKLTDIESLVEDRKVDVVFMIPDFAKPEETISGSVLLPRGEAVKSIQILQDGKEIAVSEDGSFEAVLPKEGESKFDLLVTLEDGREAERQVTVLVDNTAPVIEIIPDKTPYCEGDNGVFRLDFKDIAPVDNIKVVYDGSDLEYDRSGQIKTGTLTAGEHTIEVTAADSAGNQATETYKFTVERDNAGGEENPDNKEFTIRLNRSVAAVGDTIEITVTIPEEMDSSSLQVKNGDTEIPMENGVGVFIPEKTGDYTFTATVKNAEGEEVSKEAVCKVYDLSDKTAPEIKIATPKQEAVLTDVTKVTGSVTDNKEVESYLLEYAMEGSKDYILIAEGNEQKKDEMLGTIDTTMLMNGKYNLRLTAKDKGGNTSFVEQQFTVEGNLKVGAMHIGFTDITSEIGGTKVAVNRMYDSRNKQKGDFGIGWTLGMQGLEIYENSPLSDGYEMVQSGSLFSTTYRISETKNHDVTIAYGDGTSDHFELVITPDRKALVPISEVTLGYRCVTNQKVKLEILGEPKAYVSGSELIFYEESMYNALSYKLTTEDGVKIYIKSGKGVYQIEDTNDNLITVDKDGYHAKDGKSITFKRDKEGRIITATDVAGNVTKYVYDKQGDLVTVTDSADRTVTFTYDKEHNLASITDPMGVAVARNEYDDDGRLIATIDADGNRVEYDYDVEGRTQSVTDRRGNTTVYTYDDNGNILQTVDAYGNKTNNTYDEHNNLLSTTDAENHTTSYSYDSSGNVTQVTAADGTKVESTYTQDNLVSSVEMLDKTVMALQYDDRGRITSVEDANGNATEYSYTADGKLSGLTDEIGEYQRITYDAEGNVASTTNGAGESASYTYDKDGRCTSVTISRIENGETKTFTSHYSYNDAGDITESVDNAGNITTYEYDLNGNRTAAVDAEGRRITYSYDEEGNLIKTGYPDGTFESFTYDANGNNLTATDRSGLTVSMTYDKLDRLTVKTYADGTKETYSYDKVGNLTSHVSTSGAETAYAYDSRNRNTSITDVYGNVTAFEYDEAARLTGRIDAAGNETSYAYDDNGNIIKTTFADGNSITSEYDERNRIISQKDQNGNETKYAYDGADRLVSVEDAYGSTFAYGYDGNGNMITVTDAEGNVTTYSYDEVGRIKTLTNALGKTMEYDYDRTGNLTGYKDYAGTVITYAYDNMNRLVKKTVGSDTVSYRYSDKGQLIEVTDKSGTVGYGYDEYNRLSSVTDVRGITLSYNYDKEGRLITFDNGFGKTSYEYDLLDRVTKVIDRNGKATVYEYDILGNRSAVRYPNGNVMTYTYDACQRLKEECITNAGGVVLSKYTYGLGKAGERLSITEENSMIVTELSYDYDKLNRLVKETIECNDSKIINEYSYDKNSNRTEKKTTVKGDIAEIADTSLEEAGIKEGTTAYTYNALNQLITEQSEDTVITYTYDDNGNLIRESGDKIIDYSYDKENHLLRAIIQKENSVTVESYTYDYAGNRTSKTVNETDVTYYVNDTAGSLTQIVAETDKNGTETAFYTRGEDLISMEKDGEIWYYLYDGHGSVRLLTNEAGRITDRYAYDAYGNLLKKAGDTENEFLYTGEQYNANTGLYYLRARYMNPGTGTFISMDSYQGSIYDPVSLHKYLYANANPVMYTDPSGYFSFASLVTCTSMSQILSASWKFITLSSIMGAVSGAVFGAVDSILGGNEFSKVIQDSLKGAAIGLVLGCVISTLACFAVVYPWALTVLQITRGAFLIYGGVGVYVSLEKGNTVQAIFRAVLAIFAYRNMGKLIENVELVKVVSNETTGNAKYENASLWERITVKKVNVNDLKANPLDEFSNPKIGPSDKAVTKYMEEINTTGTLSEPIEVQKLSDGGYEIVNGHHRWLAAIKTGLEKVPIKIKNYSN